MLVLVAACGGSLSPSTPDASTPDAPTSDSPSEPAFSYAITISDPGNALAAAHAELMACARGGLDEWGHYLTGAGTLTVELRVTTTATGRLGGASTSNVALGSCVHTPSCTLVEEQAIHRLRTGQDNPAHVGEPDVHIDIDPTYWNSQVWVDPDPSGRTATVPSNRLDCVSLMTHELGHALGMTGFRSLSTFQPTGAFQSLYDDQVIVGTGTVTFEGPLTRAEFGPVPLTRTNTTQNVYHYGDPSTPSELDAKLMNGVVYRYGVRYRVGRLDVRILQDLGVPDRQLPDN